MVPSLGQTTIVRPPPRAPRRPLWQASRLERGGGATRTRPHRLTQPLRLPTRDATSPEQQRPPVWPSSARVPTSFVLPAALPRRPPRLAANASCLPAVFGDVVNQPANARPACVAHSTTQTITCAAAAAATPPPNGRLRHHNNSVGPASRCVRVNQNESFLFTTPHP